MKNILFLQSDIQSVLQPLFWLCLVLFSLTVLMTVLGLAFYFFARWYWVDREAERNHTFLHHLAAQETQVLEQSIDAATTEEERARLIVVRLADQGFTEQEIAARTGLEKRTVDGWLHIYEETGLAGLR